MIKLFCSTYGSHIVYFNEDIHDWTSYLFKNSINNNIKMLLLYYATMYRNNDDNDSKIDENGFYEIAIKCTDEFENVKFLEKYILYMLKSGQSCYFALSDIKIKTRIIYTILDNVNKNIIKVSDVMILYKEPEKTDKILIIEKQIDETKEIMVKNISLVLDRGERIDDLLKKVETLDNISLEFYNNTRSSCCRLF